MSRRDTTSPPPLQPKALTLRAGVLGAAICVLKGPEYNRGNSILWATQLLRTEAPVPTKPRLVKTMGFPVFQWSCMDVRAGQQRKLSAEELMLLNCGVGEDS